MIGPVPNRPTRILIRQALICLGAPVLVAFAVSSPSDFAFWAVLVGGLAVMIPGLAVVSWLWRDIRRIERNRPS
jgi:hypothetical protein